MGRLGKGPVSLSWSAGGFHRRRGKGGEPEMAPAVPEKPRPLSGGAAAPLELDE
jgi:hypothetical protein